MSETCTECGEPATTHAPTCWLGPRAASAPQDDQRPDTYPSPLPCDGTRTGTGSRCGGRGWYEGEEADIYCSCAAGERLRKSE